MNLPIRVLAAGLAAAFTALALAASGSAATASDRELMHYGYYSWMHKDVKKAWEKGYEGQKTRVIVVDDFT